MIKKDKIKLLWFFLGPYKFYFLFLIILSVFIGFLEALNVSILYPMLSSGLGTSATQNEFLGFIDVILNFIPVSDVLVKYCVLFIFFAFLVFVIKTIYFFFSVKIMAKLAINVKQKIFSKCVFSDYQFFIDNKQGDIIYKMLNAPDGVTGIVKVITNIFVEIILSASIFILLFSMSFKGAILILIGGIGYYYLTKYLSEKVHYVAGKKRLEHGQKETVVINEFTTGFKQIKVFETFSYWRNIFDNAINTYWKYRRKSFFWTHIPEIFLMMLVYLCIGCVVIFIKLENPNGFLSTIPVIGTFAFAIFMIMPKITKFGNYRMIFMSALPNAEAAYNILKDTTYNKIQNGYKNFSGLKSGIKLENVKFNYKDRNILLNDISLDIQKDKIVALAGSSGSGKSTIAHLLLRLHDIDDGNIVIDDVDIKEYDIFSFLKKVGYVSQDTFIFNASIKENIAFGEKYTEEEIIKSAKLANADEFIQTFPEKYDTIVGDQGARLSGGEKQRIAIARAMIRKPEILILDEATSSLDNISENIVQKAINKVSKNCTTFIIAHRLSTIQNADIIYVIDQGKIVESGNHQELLEKKGKYWELYNIQR